MKQAIHIFCKDARCLWLTILLWLCAVVIFTAMEAQNLSGAMDGWQIVAVNVVVLIYLAIDEEPLSGQRHFWLTRPYSRRSLLASKVMFMLAFIVLPVFVSDCVILYTQGFPILGHLPVLILRRIFMAAVLVVPAFAISALSPNVVAFVAALTISGVCLAATLLRVSSLWTLSGMEYLAVGSIGILLIAIWRQYADRRTLRNAVIACSAFLLPLAALPLNPERMLSLHQRLNPPAASLSNIKITDTRTDTGGKCMQLEGVVSGVPDRIHLSPLAVKYELRALNGDTWKSGWVPMTAHLTTTFWNQYACETTEAIKRFGHEQSLTLHASLMMMVAESTGVYTVPARSGPITIPGAGICEIKDNPQPSLYCRQDLAYPLADVAIAGSGPFQNNYLERPFADESSGGLWHYPFCSPPQATDCELGAWFGLNAVMGISPVYRTAALENDRALQQAEIGGEKLQFRTWKHTGIIRREVEIANVRIPVLR